MAASVLETVCDPQECGRFGIDEHEIASKSRNGEERERVGR